jgi:hypothetical protein
MADIDIGNSVGVVPTVCAPVEYVRTLTTSANAIEMWKYGAVAGFLTCLGMVFAYVYVGPRVFAYGAVRGWWS